MGSSLLVDHEVLEVEEVSVGHVLLHLVEFECAHGVQVVSVQLLLHHGLELQFIDEHGGASQPVSHQTSVLLVLNVRLSQIQLDLSNLSLILVVGWVLCSQVLLLVWIC